MSTAARMVKSSLCSIFITFSLVSCATQVAKVHTPAAMFMSAEASGKSFDGRFLITAQSGTEGRLTLMADEIENAMELSNTVTPLGLGLDLGLFEIVDIYARASSHESPAVLGLKFQLMGDPRSKANKGNHSIAVAFGTGSSYSSEEDFELAELNEDVDLKDGTHQAIYEAALLYSFRNAKETVLYSNLRIAKHSLQMEIDDQDHPAIDGKELNYQSTTITLSGGITRYFSKAFASLEISAQHSKWTNNDPTTFGLIGGALGWYWD